jgi:hypothetical protein
LTAPPAEQPVDLLADAIACSRTVDAARRSGSDCDVGHEDASRQ